MRGYGYERPQEQSPPEEQSYTLEAPPPQLPPVQQNYYQPDYGRRKTLDEVETVQDLADYLIPEAINAFNQQVAAGIVQNILDTR
jgi:hypothetical protein